MPSDTPAIAIDGLVRRYGRTDAVNGLSLSVRPGRCYGFFGRNGAGKTTTIKCLLNLLRPSAGSVRVFGLDPQRDEVGVKSRLAYVPDNVAFYPWMTVRATLDYFASFRARWNETTERALLAQFRLDPGQKASHLSKGQRTQLALITAICAEPELLVLDEPTSGLDPIVRREFIQTVIGAYQEGDPGRRTVFVSTHLISEFEGLIDEFTIIENGKQVLTLDADAARERYQKIYARFAVRARDDGSRRRAGAAPARPRVRGAGERQRGRRHGAAAGALARVADDGVAHARGDLRHDAAAWRGGGGVIQKEFRALLPAWTVAAVSMLAASTVHSLNGLAGPVYVVGAAVLGAMAIGHEYSHHTVGLLLTLPVSRPRVLLTKLGVLAAMLSGLMAVAWATIPVVRWNAPFSVVFLCLPPLAALSITPWLTMISRSPVAGAVFTLSLGGVLLVVGEWIGVASYGYSREVDAFRVMFLWWSMAVLSVAGAVMTWWTFSRLQAIDGRGTELDLAPRAGAVAHGLTRHNAGWLLMKKELRLQQLALALAGLYVLIYVTAAFSSIAPPRFEDATTILTIMYGGLLAIVIGSMASAEERNWRTLDSQLLLPMRSSRQWLVKTAAVLGLAFVLALAVPAALISVLPPNPLAGPRVVRQLFAPSTVIMVTGLTVLSLYVSTLCSSGLWALLLSVPAAFGVFVFVMKLGDLMEGALYSLGHRPDAQVMERSAGLLTAVMIALVLRLALANHRSADRSRWRDCEPGGLCGRWHHRRGGAGRPRRRPGPVTPGARRTGAAAAC